MGAFFLSGAAGLLGGWAVLAFVAAPAQTTEQPGADAATATSSIDEAQRLFYSGRYDAAAGMAMRLRAQAPDDLATYELRTSALHFLIKQQIGDAKDRQAALKACGRCPDLIQAIRSDTDRAREIAHGRLKQNPRDVQALYMLGKIDLTHVWLHLGTLGQRTGWDEYWEARHSLDEALRIDPPHVRARIARAWIDYIVDTRVPHGLRWVLGGGSTKRALTWARQAAAADTDEFSNAEASFGLWEMLVREGDTTEARAVAVTLARRFPDNQQIARFLSATPARDGH